MKVYSIGREQGCDILINDRTDVISRRHATLNVESFGKMTIVDQSTNGTYVNGIRISPNVPVPVTRKDNISFAHVARLDWSQVPSGGVKYLRWAGLLCVALILLIGAVFGIKSIKKSDAPAPTQAELALDSIEKVRKGEELKKREEARKDSIEKVVKDSLNKLKPINNPKKNKAEKKAQPKVEEKKKPETDNKEPKDNKGVKRADR